MDKILQAGLSAGMSTTNGFHSNKSKTMDPETGVPLGQSHLLPQDMVPTSETNFTHKGANGDVLASPLSIGAWSWGDSATWQWKPEERPNIDELWAYCLKTGVNFIDTAQAYGDGASEEIIGELISRGNRSDFVIQTKYFVVPDAQNLLHPKAAPMIKLKESLERMKTDYVDIYMIHGPIHVQRISTVAKNAAECVQEGLAKCIGVANYSADDMIKFQEELAKYGVPLACNQIEFHPFRRMPETNGVLEECKKRGIVCQSYSSLAQGRLTGKYTKDNPPPSTHRFSSYPMEEYEPMHKVLESISKKRGVSMSAVSLNYNLSKGVLPVVGMRNIQQAEEDCQALGWRLTAEEVQAIDEVSVQGKTTALWQQG